ncbi:hypothetical protein TNCV_704271 [Trichonephila clavipes]|nr:hypothetical protein TNCV_704271 [Trichonephila clavipes]
MIVGDTTYLHLHNLGMWTGGEGNILQHPAPLLSDVTTHKTFGHTDLMSTCSVCSRRVFGASGIEPKPSGQKSDVLTPRLPTALKCFVTVIDEMFFSQVVKNTYHPIEII